jgi:hypothetical protein
MFFAASCEVCQVADRVRVAASRKRGGAKRPAKKKPRRRPLGIFFLVALMTLILGFLARRMMIPSAVHYLAHRPPDEPRRSGEVETPATTDDASNAGANRDESLSNSDRRQLNEIIKRKAK